MHEGTHKGYGLLRLYTPNHAWKRLCCHGMFTERCVYGPVWYSSQQLHELLWAVFFCQTLISKTASWVKLFFPSSHKDISWIKLEKSSLLQLLLISLSLNYVWSSWWSYFVKHFFQNSSASSRKSLMKLFSKKTVLLVKLSCVKQALHIRTPSWS